MHLIPCRSIGKREIKRDDEARMLIVEKSAVVVFTRTEYRLLVLLLDHAVVPDATLNESLFATRLADDQMKKTRGKQIENSNGTFRHTSLVVRRIHLSGYSLVAEDEAVSAGLSL